MRKLVLVFDSIDAEGIFVYRGTYRVIQIIVTVKFQTLTVPKLLRTEKVIKVPAMIEMSVIKHSDKDEGWSIFAGNI